MHSIFRICTICFLAYTFCDVQASNRQIIAKTADKYVASTKWSYASRHATGRNTNKCNIFVADIVEELGGTVPRRWFGLSGPIGAGEWGNPDSTYLNDSCWMNVDDANIGDIISDGVHVAIVTGNRTTTSAARHAVVKNDWGFRSNQSGTNFTVWRYICPSLNQYG